MMDRQALIAAQQVAARTDDFEAHAAFVKLLLASNDDATLAYHYDLLREREPRSLFLRLRAAFAKRGAEGARFLVARLGDEASPAMRAELLHLLGRLRAPEGLMLARTCCASDDPELRLRACYVLGWLGGAEDVARLAERLGADPDAAVRRTAATAHSQLHDRLPELRDPLLASLHRAVVAEGDPEVLSWIVVTVQYVLKKRFGLRENVEEALVVGDLPGALKKCRAALDRLALP